MIYPSGDELEKRVDSKYTLVVAVAKRVKQLKDGSPRLIETKSRNPITIALEEIAAGKLEIGTATPEEMAQMPQTQTVPQPAELLRVAGEEAEEAPKPKMSEAEALRQALSVTAEEEEAEEETPEAVAAEDEEQEDEEESEEPDGVEAEEDSEEEEESEEVEPDEVEKE